MIYAVHLILLACKCRSG